MSIHQMAAELIAWLRLQVDLDEKDAEDDGRAWREVDAKRLLLDYCSWAEYHEVEARVEFVLKPLAAIYRDEPGFRREWQLED